MKNNLFYIVVLSASIASSGGAFARTCFCKAMCYFVNKESSDFTLSQDVSCDLSLSEKQAFLWAELRVHMASEHGKFQDKDVSKHSKITCYEASPVIK